MKSCETSNKTYELDNDVEGKEFKVVIWRTTQKDEITTQKRVLEYFKNNPKGTRVEAANALGYITEDGVKFVIGKLRQNGFLKRAGGRKYGEWQVISDADIQTSALKTSDCTQK